jgi:hypothetical protein
MDEMQLFEIPVIASDGSKVMYPIYVGKPIKGVHPLEQQAAALRRERNLVIPQEIMDSFEKLANISLENEVDFAELVVYAMDEAQTEVAAEGSEAPEGGGAPETEGAEPAPEGDEPDEDPDGSA